MPTILLLLVISTVVGGLDVQPLQAQQGVSPQLATDVPRIFNTVRLKLAAGEAVVGATVTTSDPEIYCAMAGAGFDFMWIEMQHSPLTYSEVARMIWACRDAPAIPFIRVPAATEGDIQKATDIGALGIIVPMVDDIGKVRDAVTFSHYPPIGKRSQGGGQYRALWGSDYRESANENVMVVAMIESPAGVQIAREIANEPGVDIVFAASTDLSSFTGLLQGNPRYEEMIGRIRDETQGAGLTVGGPLAWKEARDGYGFFQGPTAASLIITGAAAVLSSSDPCLGIPAGEAPVQGEDPCPL